MRAFIAIEVAAEVRAAVGALAAELEGRVPEARWILPSNLHITLRFLGNTSEATLKELADSLRPVLAACVPFRLEFRGIGLFPSPRRARVMGALIRQPPLELEAVYRNVESTVGRYGFPPEPRKFTPHLTFARLRTSSAALPRIQTELDHRDLGHVSVHEVIVFESILRPAGAVYHVWARLPLGETRQ